MMRSITRPGWNRLMWQYSRGSTWVGGNFPPWVSVLGFEVGMFWNWKCCFWRLIWWFSKFYLQQHNQDLMMWKYTRGGTWVSGNWPTLSYLCLVSKYLLVGLGWISFEFLLDDFRKSILFNIIPDHNMFPLDGYTILIRWCKYHKDNKS